MKYWPEFTREIEDSYNPIYGVAFWQCPECLSTRVCLGYDYHNELWCNGLVFFHAYSYNDARRYNVEILAHHNDDDVIDGCNNPYGVQLHEEVVKCESQKIDSIGVLLRKESYSG